MGAPIGAPYQPHTQSDTVVDDAPITGVAATGSVAAGRSIASRAGQNLKPSSMELGGSDAFRRLQRPPKAEPCLAPVMSRDSYL